MSFSYGWRGPNIIKDGLVLYLDPGSPNSYYNKTDTVIKDISGNSYNGTLTNSPTYETSGSGCFQFDGSNEFITLGNQQGLGFTTGTFSVSAWVYVPSSWTGGSQYPNLISKGGSAGWDTNGWSLYLFRNYIGGFGFGLGIRNGTSTVQASTYVTLGVNDVDKFINMTACMDLTSIKMYQNGVLKKTVTALTTPLDSPLVAPPSTSTDVIISKGPSTQYFPGKVSIITAYNKKLTDLEVLQNYNATKSRFGL